MKCAILGLLALSLGSAAWAQDQGYAPPPPQSAPDQQQAAPPRQQAASVNASEQELIDMEAAWAKAIVANDTAALSKIVSPEWRGQGEQGKWMDRDAMFKRLSENKITSMTNHDVHVRIVGDMAIVQGMDDETDVVKGKPTKMVYSWTDIYRKQDGKWVAIASQNTPVSGEK